ncbi:olfactory receptor 13C9-like [Ascaphus truei]|uniref:olfactory receptor 13C9-like n=1 Tax=Ascaphus truei TaxID=8439 RepID=UPI003F5A7229
MEKNNQTAVKEFIFLGLSQDPKTNMLFFLLFLITYIITLLGNALIMILVITDHHLHIPMYYFLCNLSAIDILFTSCTVPKSLDILMSLRKNISFNGCMVQLYIALLLGNTECILLAVMAYDRYVAICSPLHYTIIMKRTFCCKIAFTSWGCGVLFATVPLSVVLSFPFCGQNKINHVTCEYLALRELACRDTTFIQMLLLPITLVLLLLPFAFIVASYVLIIRSILKIHSADGRYQTFSTCASHLTVVSMFYGAAMILYMGPKNKNLTYLEKYLSLFYGVVTPFLNPIIYSLRNNEVKGALLKALEQIVTSVHA